MRTELSSLKKRIKKDSRFMDFKKSLSARGYNIAFDQMKRELEGLHESRKIKEIKVTDAGFGKKFVKAMQLEVSCRSRMVEMKVVLTSIDRDVAKTLEHLQDYLLLAYADRLKILSTKDERKRFVEGVLRDQHTYVANIKAMLEIISIYIEDIDKASYAVKNMAEIYSVIFRNEGKTLGAFK